MINVIASLHMTAGKEVEREKHGGIRMTASLFYFFDVDKKITSS